MAFVPVPSNETITKTFNSGLVDLNTGTLTEVTNISLTISQSAVGYYPLNKRIKSQMAAGNVEFSGQFDVEGGLYVSLLAAFYGSSSPVTGGTEYSAIDTQPATPTLNLTVYEKGTTTPIQFQVVDCVITDISPSLEQENYGKQTFSFECTQIKTFVNTSISQ